MVKVKETKRNRITTGGVRLMGIVTFIDEPTQENYDLFLCLRDERGGSFRNENKSPLVDIDGLPQWASFDYQAE